MVRITSCVCLCVIRDTYEISGCSEFIEVQFWMKNSTCWLIDDVLVNRRRSSNFLVLFGWKLLNLTYQTMYMNKKGSMVTYKIESCSNNCTKLDNSLFFVYYYRSKVSAKKYFRKDYREKKGFPFIIDMVNVFFGQVSIFWLKYRLTFLLVLL